MDNINYMKALCEVDDILSNTDESLINMLPISFIKWIKENKLRSYKTEIKNDIPLGSQKLQPETEAIIALIFRKYWSNDEEKNIFDKKDKKEFIELENETSKIYPSDTKTIFNNRKDIKKIPNQNASLDVIKTKTNIFRVIINKIKSFFTNR